MGCGTSNSTTDASCDCGTGQTRSDIACPVCRILGATVGFVTPENTLKRSVREKLDAAKSYHFCENPDCSVVYYNDQDTSVFARDDLIHAVTIKDSAPETRLCYCFKVLKAQALKEIAETGTTNVFQTIQAKMKPGQSCFCEKANPRGDTCSKDILAWLDQQGIRPESTETEPDPVEAVAQSGCCTPAPVAESTQVGCCGRSPAKPAPQKSGCC